MVTSVHEENGETLSNAKALLQGRVAEAGYQYKVNDYGELPTKNSFHFSPFIVENHGFIHPQSLKLLEVLAGNRIANRTLHFAIVELLVLQSR
jgi:hypothetical protein